jgi:hypothetical protein
MCSENKDDIVTNFKNKNIIVKYLKNRNDKKKIEN